MTKNTLGYKFSNQRRPEGRRYKNEKKAIPHIYIAGELHDEKFVVLRVNLNKIQSDVVNPKHRPGRHGDNPNGLEDYR